MATNMMDSMRVQNANNLIRSFQTNDGRPRAYVFIGKSTVWDNELEPPKPNNSIQEFYETSYGIIAMKNIERTDAYHMIRRVHWGINVVYDTYRHDITKQNPSYSGQYTLYDSNFYVLNSENDVFVCLDNNGDNPSMEEPRNRTGEPFYTSDGYQWLYIYNVTPTLKTFHSTPNYIPVITTQADVRVAGEILTVMIDNNGSDYTDKPNGSPTRVRAYYAKIKGDGKGAVAKVHMSGTFISRIEVVRQGSGYTFGKLEFEVNKVYRSLYDLDTGLNPLDPEGNDDFASTVIISPQGGWRSNNQLHLGGTTVGVFSRILFDLKDFDVDLPFRQIGIIHDPILSHEESTASGVFSMKVKDDGVGVFLNGETIYQEVDGRTALGTICFYDEETQILRYFQSPYYHLYDGELVPFAGTEPVIGRSGGKSVLVDTSYTADESSISFVDGYGVPEYKFGSGNIIYLANTQPIQRERNQSEKLSVMIHF